jgi:hypothetical protein
MKTLKLAIVALLLVAAPAFATPVTVSGAGQQWTNYYNGIVDINGVATVMPGLSSQVQFRVTGLAYDAGLDKTLLSMDIVVKNTTDATIWQNASLVGIGFDTNPNVARNWSGSSGDYDFIALNQLLPTGSGFVVEVCIAGRLNRCNGPASLGTQIGEVGTASVVLAFFGDITGQGIVFDNFGVRYSNGISNVLSRWGDGGIGLPVTPPIPEPAAAAVFGIGALVVGAALRRMRVR